MLAYPIMKFIKYKTAAGDTIDELDVDVNRLINEGFEVFGSPYYIGKTDGNVDAAICQAMVMTQEAAAQLEMVKAESMARLKNKWAGLVL